MKLATSFLLAMGVILLAPELSAAPVRSAQSTPTIAEVIQSNPGAEIRRVNSKKWARLPEIRSGDKGMPLSLGDLLRVRRGSIVRIRCLTDAAVTRTVPDDGIPWGVANACSPRSAN